MEKTLTEASVEVSDKLQKHFEETGFTAEDLGSKPSVNVATGHISNAKTDGDGVTFRVSLPIIISISKEYEVTIDRTDKVTYTEVV